MPDYRQSLLSILAKLKGSLLFWIVVVLVLYTLADLAAVLLPMWRAG